MQLEIVEKSPQELIPYKLNAKKHSQDQIERLARVMQELGYDVPIVIDEDNNILKGHCRREAAIFANMELVSCIVRRNLTEVEKSQLRLSDNKLAESPWDEDMLKLELEMLMGESADMELTGFTEDDIDNLFNDDEEPEPPDNFDNLNPDAMGKELNATCPRCKYQFTVTQQNG